jgi:hypothetical protein
MPVENLPLFSITSYAVAKLAAGVLNLSFTTYFRKKTPPKPTIFD